MSTNDFLPFANASGANVESQSDWAGSGVQLNGFSGGIVPSATFNKALRQASALATALAQAISDLYTLDFIDDDLNWATIVNNIKFGLSSLPGGTAKQIPYQIAAGISGFIAAPTASGQTLTYNGTNIVWGTSGGGFVTNGYALMGNGLILQWGQISFSGGGSASATLPTTFPHACLNAQATLVNPTGSDTGYDQGAQITSFSTSSITVCMGTYGGGSANFPADAYWFAIGY